jgi:AbrB family looped-hinge helix DNA binding protein
MPRAKPTTVDRFGRVLIPKALREAAGLCEGTNVEVIKEDHGLRIVPREESVLLKAVKGVLIASGEAAGDLAAAVRRHRQQRLGKLAGRR